MINSEMLAKSTDIFHSCRGDGVGISIRTPAGHSFFLHELKDFATAGDRGHELALAIRTLLCDAGMTADRIRIAISDIHINPEVDQRITLLTERLSGTRKSDRKLDQP
ncbi:hypothetical protein [Rhodococcus jostii]|uniref:Uncharacterized protein n=1 Tax=Rhodococcus jostii TaxID=132919 RepID=A0ABU4C9Q8_RHOJO|nr:hypothetical protein [Rhodococcus jostii]MDV6280287.1 hypothetical protein [Rhodococcus jostii]